MKLREYNNILLINVLLAEYYRKEKSSQLRRDTQKLSL